MAREVTVSTGSAAAAVLAALVVGSGIGAVVTGPVSAPTNTTAGAPGSGTAGPADGGTAGEPLADASVSAFESRASFRSYLRAAERHGGHVAQSGATAGGRGEERREVDAVEREDGAATPVGTPSPRAVPDTDSGDDADGAPRTSGTNVQVSGIDEPDRLKTAPGALFYAERGRRLVGDEHHRDEDRAARRTHVVDTSDPAAPEVAAELDVSGRLLLVNDTLVVVQGDRLAGYDVADRSAPERVWTRNVTGRIVTARLYAGHVYLVTAESIDRRRPCPVEPVEGGPVDCTDIHHPDEPVPVDSTYVVTVLDPDTGSVDDATGFVGTRRQSAVYVSKNAVYLTYSKQVSRADLLLEFLLENQSERLDDSVRSRLRELRRYDLSDRAKRYEVRVTIREWFRGMDEERREELQRAVRRDREAWVAANKREFQRTGIVEFALRNPESETPSVETAGVGTVPGRPLNQFSLDEHEGRLRIATTVDPPTSGESENDVYVLDKSLSVVGSVTGMGVTERIYSVRFRGDEAYVVTFRRIDPFHVIDLSDPRDPTLEGELKLPGFSSYLHPLGDDRVLGIGEEDGRVKLVVFDVSDPTDPAIADSRVLDARWSAVAESHHAFLHDPKHGVFFLPTGDAGLVYRYDGGLERVATVEGRAERAAYVGDYLYVFGPGGVVVVDETTWERTHTLAF